MMEPGEMISDIVGRKPLLIIVAFAFVLIPYPLFKLFLSGASFPVLVVRIVYCFPSA